MDAIKRAILLQDLKRAIAPFEFSLLNLRTLDMLRAEVASRLAKEAA
jgi:hypothetical protein